MLYIELSTLRIAEVTALNGSLRMSGDDRYHDRADKNEFSHPHDALQYLMLGAGEGRALLGRQRHARAGPPPQRANSNYRPLHWRV